MRRQGELPRRAALHDARPVGDAQREDARVPLVGDARRPGGASERQAGGGDQGFPPATPGEGRGIKQPIYLDYSATSPMDPRVPQKMIPYLSLIFAHPRSTAKA